MFMTIMAEDNTVLMNGEPWPVDCGEFSKEGIACIQVYGDWAEVEYLQAPGVAHIPNLKIFEGHPKHQATWNVIRRMERQWQTAEAEQRIKEMQG
jgi:hypothetical protein